MQQQPTAGRKEKLTFNTLVIAGDPISALQVYQEPDDGQNYCVSLLPHHLHYRLSVAAGLGIVKDREVVHVSIGADDLSIEDIRLHYPGFKAICAQPPKM